MLVVAFQGSWGGQWEPGLMHEETNSLVTTGTQEGVGSQEAFSKVLAWQEKLNALGEEPQVYGALNLLRFMRTTLDLLSRGFQ